jgi:outer membrane protein OmpA-like peptidoglycan-associated protein
VKFAHRRTHHSDEEHWIPLSDLMTGLMLVFLLIAVTYMVQVEAQTKKVRQIAVIYDQLRNDLYRDLNKEFHADLKVWGAELDRNTLTVRFTEPKVLFETGKSDLRPEFKQILDSFFPRYVKILRGQKYKNSISEVRIEGHTSSIWESDTSIQNAYILNMELSQTRTRSVLEYLLAMPVMSDSRTWLMENVTANGLSSSKIIRDESGKEDQYRSQRVEFRVRTNAETKLAEILEAGK